MNCEELRKEVFIFPTETVYGIGAWVFNPKAVKKIFEIKGRPSDNPLIVHISNMEQLQEVATDIPEIAYRLMEKYWPGPLTLVLKKHPSVPSIVTGNKDTIAVRMPDHEVALKIIECVGPVAAPSANISGKPSITTYEHALEEFKNKVKYIFKGETKEGIESTVISLIGKPVLLRPGPITFEELKSLIPDLEISTSKKALAPGMKYPHYRPSHKLYLIFESYKGPLPKTTGAIWKKGIKAPKASHVFYYENEKELAQNLYYWIRELDKKGTIQVWAPKKEGLGHSILNRLEKAAHIILQ